MESEHNGCIVANVCCVIVGVVFDVWNVTITENISELMFNNVK